MSTIADRLQAVKASLAEACRAVGRLPEEVKLVAVSKTFPVSAAQAACAAGQMDFGENRVQEYLQKQPLLPAAHWHLIGPLQTNKVKYVVDTVHLIHSLDSERLASEIQKRAKRPVDCLIQINISGEGQKSGIPAEELPGLLRCLPQYPQVRVRGMMGIAELTEDTNRIRSQFARLRGLYDQLGRQTSEQVQMQHLSMGMSGDYALAIAEGATMVRIGSAIFGGRS
ncbi:MAG: YggS family pyridoxal phosphate-dependent enzyme [Bacteroidetes bacterium]|jgi:pyridoxal phosphate enzyme (YggS family)|nr:YggS family pyridoxal phosphate-dependent enzyme [Bacteroidota bacterium]